MSRVFSSDYSQGSVHRWTNRFRDSNLPTMRTLAWSDVVYVYVSNEPRLFLSLYDCFSHRRVHLLCFLFSHFFLAFLFVRLDWPRRWLTDASRRCVLLIYFFLSLFLLANRPTFVNSVILLRPWRWRQWLPASSYFPPDSGFPAAGASIRRPM